MEASEGRKTTEEEKEGEERGEMAVSLGWNNINLAGERLTPKRGGRGKEWLFPRLQRISSFFLHGKEEGGKSHRSVRVKLWMGGSSSSSFLLLSLREFLQTLDMEGRTGE